MTKSKECVNSPHFLERITTKELIELFKKNWSQVIYCCREGLTRSPGIATAHNKLHKPPNYPPATYLEGGLQTLVNYYCCNHFGRTSEEHKKASKKLICVLKSTRTLIVVVVEEYELTGEVKGALAELNRSLEKGKVVLCPNSELSSHFGTKAFVEGNMCGLNGRVIPR